MDDESQDLALDLDLDQSTALIGDIMVIQRSYLLTMKRDIWDGGSLDRNRQDEGTFGSHLQVRVKGQGSNTSPSLSI